MMVDRPLNKKKTKTKTNHWQSESKYFNAGFQVKFKKKKILTWKSGFISFFSDRLLHTDAQVQDDQGSVKLILKYLRS